MRPPHRFAQWCMHSTVVLWTALTSFTAIASSALAVSDPCNLVGDCASSPNYPSAYSNKQHCTVGVNSDGFLTAQTFDTELNYDKLSVGGVNYSGSVGPMGVIVQARSTISWESDRSLTGTGWLICWSGSSPAPTTAAPTTTAALVTRQSLLDLYWATNGPGWLRSTDWGTDVFYCHWHGVICKNNEVATLNLPWNSLSGSLPTSLSSLTGLSDVVRFSSYVTCVS